MGWAISLPPQVMRFMPVTISTQIDPFCKIGDLTAPSKSYLNIQTLLKKLGVEFEKIGNKANNLWESNLEPS